MKKRIVQVLIFILFINISLFSVPQMIENPFPSVENLNNFKADDYTKYSQNFLDNTQISLITITPGKEVFSWFGHSAIRISNPDIEDRLFDTGVFSYTDTFVQDLVQGKLYFGAYQSYAEGTINAYERENRIVSTLPLTLTNLEKAETIEFINYHSKWENHIYLYDYYLDNCATRLRDIINKNTDDDLKTWASDIGEGTTFRKLTTHYMTRNFLINFVFNYLEGPSIDYPINRYEASFIPEKLELLVKDYQNNKSNSLTEYPTLGSTFYLCLEALVISLIICCFLYLGEVAKSKKMRRGVAFINFALFLFLTVASSILLYMQNFSYHQVTYNNENLFFISPFVLFIAIESLIRIFNLGFTSKLATFTYKVLLIVSFSFVIIKGIFPSVFVQDNLYVFTFIFPLYLKEVLVREQRKRQAKALTCQEENISYYY